ncbi:MAG: SMC-Scp complex subunit ScpB [Quadrisphaera sp.]
MALLRTRLVARFAERGAEAVSFAELIADAGEGSAADGRAAVVLVVGRFLAVLELYRRGELDLDQTDPAQPLQVRWRGVVDLTAQPDETDPPGGPLVSHRSDDERGEQEEPDDSSGDLAALPGGLRAALEAVLMVVDAPVSTDDLADGLGVPAERVGRVLGELAESYRDEQRGFELRAAAGGWRIWSRPEAAELVARFTGEAASVRLSKAALETLAVIAYTQPVTRARVAAVRGVDVDSVVRTLLTRGLVTEAGKEGPGGGTLYRTTTAFLEKIGGRQPRGPPSAGAAPAGRHGDRRAPRRPRRRAVSSGGAGEEQQ